MLRLKRLMLPLCVLLAACAGTREAERSPTLAHVPTQTLPDGHVAVLVREYDDEVKLDGGREQRMHVRYLWDYTAAVAREIQTAPDGTLLSDATRPALTLMCVRSSPERANVQPALSTASGSGRMRVDSQS